MKIIRGRLKPQAGTTYEFISVKSRIKHMIEKNKKDIFDFVIDDGGRRAIKTFGPENINPELVGKEVPIIDNDVFAKFKEDGTIDIIQGVKEEALPRSSTVAQLKRLRKATKGIDIGDRIAKLKGANLSGITNPIDTGIESYEDFEKHNKKFIPGWNMRHLKSPFRGES
jgi:predicted oxidoreductase